MRTIVAIVALARAFWPRSEAADALQERVGGGARSVRGGDYAFTRFVRLERNEGGKITQRTELERYDPARPVGQRWTLVALDGRPPTPDEMKKHARDAARRRVAHYGRVANYFAAPATTGTDAK